MENSNTISAHRSSSINYSHFTKILVCMTVDSYESNVGVLASNLAERQTYMLEESADDFNQEAHFLFGILKGQATKSYYTSASTLKNREICGTFLWTLGNLCFSGCQKRNELIRHHTVKNEFFTKSSKRFDRIQRSSIRVQMSKEADIQICKSPKTFFTWAHARSLLHETSISFLQNLEKFRKDKLSLRASYQV